MTTAGKKRRPAPAPRVAVSRATRAVKPDPAFEGVVRAIHAVRPQVPPGKIHRRSSLVTDLGIDSLSLAQLSIALEDVFGRAIFLGDVLSEVEDPASITAGQLAELLGREG